MEDQSHKWLSQGHAEDMVLWHRYNYYVMCVPLIDDGEYDGLERAVRSQWSVSVCDTVGSSNAWTYPLYVRERRRPDAQERRLRDRAIADRWMRAL